MEKVHDADLLSLQQVRDLIARAYEAQKRWATFSRSEERRVGKECRL